MRRASLALLLALAACHRRDAGVDPLDTGAEARARTAAKTEADLAAAEQASAPALARPRIAPVEHPPPVDARRPLPDPTPTEDAAPAANDAVPD